MQGSEGGMCEGPSRISGPIPPDPTLCPDYYRRPASALGRLEGNALKLDLLTSDLDLDATPPRGPRMNPGARQILERGRSGVGGVLLQLRGISLGPGASPKTCWNAEICGDGRLRPASIVSRTLPCPLATLACRRTSG